MTTIRLTNTRTRKKEVLDPLDPRNLRMYVCGPTVYDRAHLGNARPVVVFDVLFRLLRHVYGPDHVTYVRNFTDVDDKINARAAETGRPIRDITDETIRWYHEDMDALGALRPTQEPRATDWIPAMIAMTEGLVAGGHAYEASGHVLFRVRSYADYGQLSGRSVDDMIAGSRVEVAPFKEDPLDFVLWKPSDATQPGWDSPWGRGRPGWHIECSAMARELLGTSFDIHGGGLDLQFPHHENEIAQSACAHPEGEFARVWLHNEMLQIEGKKMSKSLGNFFTVRDLLDQGIPGEVIRFVLLGTHYGSPMDWTASKRDEAERELRNWRHATENVDRAEPNEEFLRAVCDDLNIPAGMEILRQMYSQHDYAGLLASANLIGILTTDASDWQWKRVDKRIVLQLSQSPMSDNEVVDPTYETIQRAVNLRISPNLPAFEVQKASDDMRRTLDKLVLQYRHDTANTALSAISSFSDSTTQFRDLFRQLSEKTARDAEMLRKAVHQAVNNEALQGGIRALMESQRSIAGELSRFQEVRSQQFRALREALDQFASEFSEELEAAADDVPMERAVFQRAKAGNIASIIAERSEARRNKDYKRADLMRDRAKQLGLELRDTASGTKWGVPK